MTGVIVLVSASSSYSCGVTVLRLLTDLWWRLMMVVLFNLQILSNLSLVTRIWFTHSTWLILKLIIWAPDWCIGCSISGRNSSWCCSFLVWIIVRWGDLIGSSFWFSCVNIFSIGSYTVRIPCLRVDISEFSNISSIIHLSRSIFTLWGAASPYRSRMVGSIFIRIILLFFIFVFISNNLCTRTVQIGLSVKRTALSSIWTATLWLSCLFLFLIRFCVYWWGRLWSAWILYFRGWFWISCTLPTGARCNGTSLLVHATHI